MSMLMSMLGRCSRSNRQNSLIFRRPVHILLTSRVAYLNAIRHPTRAPWAAASAVNQRPSLPVLLERKMDKRHESLPRGVRYGTLAVRGYISRWHARPDRMNAFCCLPTTAFYLYVLSSCRSCLLPSFGCSTRSIDRSIALQPELKWDKGARWESTYDDRIKACISDLKAGLLSALGVFFAEYKSS